jgi:hypothetical protein
MLSVIPGYRERRTFLSACKQSAVKLLTANPYASITMMDPVDGHVHLEPAPNDSGQALAHPLGDDARQARLLQAPKEGRSVVPDRELVAFEPADSHRTGAGRSAKAARPAR